MTAVTSKMNRMILLYTLILSMVSLPTSLPKRFLVETADKGGDDYSNPPSIPPLEFRKKYGTTDSAEQRNNLNMPAASRIKQPAASRKLYEENKGKLFTIPWSFISIFRHSQRDYGLGCRKLLNDKLQSTIEPNCLPTISHFSLSQLVIISLVIFGNIGINMNIFLRRRRTGWRGLQTSQYTSTFTSISTSITFSISR